MVALWTFDSCTGDRDLTEFNLPSMCTGTESGSVNMFWPFGSTSFGGNDKIVHERFSFIS